MAKQLCLTNIGYSIKKEAIKQDRNLSSSTLLLL